MSVSFRNLEPSDGIDFVNILNYYIRNGFNAYLEQEFSPDRYSAMYDMIKDYPNVACVDGSRVIGYGYLKAFRDFPCFSRTAEITYFILPEYTGLGLGAEILSRLKSGAKEQGIKVIVAHISSLNEGSVNFHKKQGFIQCGRFKNVVEKNGTVFDMIWMQTEL